MAEKDPKDYFTNEVIKVSSDEQFCFLPQLSIFQLHHLYYMLDAVERTKRLPLASSGFPVLISTQQKHHDETF